MQRYSIIFISDFSIVYRKFEFNSEAFLAKESFVFMAKINYVIRRYQIYELLVIKFVSKICSYLLC